MNALNINPQILRGGDSAPQLCERVQGGGGGRGGAEGDPGGAAEERGRGRGEETEEDQGSARLAVQRSILPFPLFNS